MRFHSSISDAPMTSRKSTSLRNATMYFLLLSSNGVKNQLSPHAGLPWLIPAPDFKPLLPKILLNLFKRIARPQGAYLQ